MLEYGPDERVEVRVTLNGTRASGTVEPRTQLADFLRHGLGAYGTHVGCEHGVCGACTVLLDGRAVRSCLLLAVQADGADVRTVEGLAENGRMNALQSTFAQHNALQCGFCTAGILISATHFLAENPAPTEEAVRSMLSGHICRCTGYQPIVEAILEAANPET